MRKDKGAYNGWDRGLGKTLGAVVLKQELGCSSIIVVAPNSSKEMVWLPEIRKWDTIPASESYVYVVKGNATSRDRAVKTWKKYGGYLLIHYEALRLVT